MVEFIVEERNPILLSGGKESIAYSMYNKGKSFLLAALLLQEKNGSEYVVIHLFCQGIECIIKGLLLNKDYDRYAPMLRKPLGHNLVKLKDEAMSAFKISYIKGTSIDPLLELNTFYSMHLFRYGNIFDLVKKPSDINMGTLEKTIFRIIRIAEKKLLI